MDGEQVDDALTRTARLRHRRVLLSAAAVLTLSLLGVGALVIVASPGELNLTDGLALAAIFLVGACPIVGTFVFFMHGSRAGGTNWYLQPSPASGLDRPDRKQLLRDIKAGRRLQGRDRSIGVDLARRMRIGLRVNIGIVPIMAVNAVMFFTTLKDQFASWFVAAMGVMYLTIALLQILVIRRYRQVRRFLAANPPAP